MKAKDKPATVAQLVECERLTKEAKASFDRAVIRVMEQCSISKTYAAQLVTEYMAEGEEDALR